MYGFLVASVDALTPAQLERYKAVYCGLCRELGESFSQSARLTLNYDMTFLVLLLSSLYEPEEANGCDRCIRHPREAKPWVRNEISAYAAGMNLVLAQEKCRDDWNDDGNIAALSAVKFLGRQTSEIYKKYPRQCEAIKRSLAELSELEKNRVDNPDLAANTFGELMAELFVYRHDRWEPYLRAMGFALGKFIYLMDAVIDLDRDTFRNSYNPLRRWYGLDNEQRFRDMLKMYLGDCIMAFDRLPLVQDVGLMQNILCFGLWTEFNRKFKIKNINDREDP